MYNVCMRKGLAQKGPRETHKQAPSEKYAHFAHARVFI